jgi:hypothetical protein
MHQRRSYPVEPFANAVIRQTHRGDVGEPAPEVDLDVHEVRVHADENRTGGPSEHEAVPRRELGGTGIR